VNSINEYIQVYVSVDKASNFMNDQSDLLLQKISESKESTFEYANSVYVHTKENIQENEHVIIITEKCVETSTQVNS